MGGHTVWNTYEICKHYIEKEQILSKYESIIYDDIMLSWFECIRAFYILETCYLFQFQFSNILQKFMKYLLNM